MEQEKQIFNLPEGVSEVTIRQGQAPKVLDEQAPLCYDVKGTIGSVAEYLRKRIDKAQFKQEDCTIIVNRESECIFLQFNERDPLRKGSVLGSIERTGDFEKLHLNDGFGWTPEKLARLFKLNRSWFKSREVNMSIVSTLLNYKADINQKVERAMQENGSKTYNFAQVVNSNLPPKFYIVLPVFKGQQPQEIEVETMAYVDGENIVFELISPGANEIINAFRDAAIDEQLKEIRTIAPEIAIIEK